MDKFLHKHVYASITVTPGLDAYGEVWIKGRRHYRNYGRELKNGRGVSFSYAVCQKIVEAGNELDRRMEEVCGIPERMLGRQR